MQGRSTRASAHPSSFFPPCKICHLLLNIVYSVFARIKILFLCSKIVKSINLGFMALWVDGVPRRVRSGKRSPPFPALLWRSLSPPGRPLTGNCGAEGVRLASPPGPVLALPTLCRRPVLTCRRRSSAPLAILCVPARVSGGFDEHDFAEPSLCLRVQKEERTSSVGDAVSPQHTARAGFPWLPWVRPFVRHVHPPDPQSPGVSTPHLAGRLSWPCASTSREKSPPAPAATYLLLLKPATVQSEWCLESAFHILMICVCLWGHRDTVLSAHNSQTRHCTLLAFCVSLY